MNRDISKTIILSLIVSAHSFAQQQDSWNNFTKADGLAGNSVFAMIVARDGALWFGTDLGVSCYREGIWTSWSTADGLAHNFVLAVLESRDGALWFGTDGGGVSRYQNGIWTTFTTAEGLAFDHVNAIHQSADGALWFGTDGGLSRFHEGDWTTFTTANGLARNYILSIFESSDGALWVGTYFGGVSRYYNDMWTTITDVGGETIHHGYAIYESRDGAIWLGTGSGIGRYKNGIWEFLLSTCSFSFCDRVEAIYESGDGTMWFGTTSGVMKLQNDEWLTLTQDDGLAENYVRAIVEASDGALWFATIGGVSRYQEAIWTTFSVNDGLGDNTVYAIHEAQDGAFWFGTSAFFNQGGATRLHNDSWKTFTTADGLANDWVRAIAESRDGTMWFGTFGGGVSRFKDGTWTTFNRDNGLAYNDVNAIIEASDGALWIGTDWRVSRYQDDTWTTFSSDDGLAHDIVYTILESRDGALWFGTAGGVSRLQDNTWTTFTPDDGLVEYEVFAIAESRDGAMWFGTRFGGVSRFLHGMWTTFTIDDGLADNTIVSIVESVDGALWFGTTEGVSRFQDGIWTNLGTTDGLVNNDLLTILQARDGALWFGTWGGVSKLKPDRTPPFTSIIEAPKDTIGTATHLFEFIGRDYRTEQDQLYYSYAIVEASAIPHDGDWQPFSKRTAVSPVFPHDGTLTFHVRARDGWGNIDPSPATATFTVDITQPTVTILSPAPESVVAAQVPIIGSAFDNSPIQDFDYYELAFGAGADPDTISNWRTENRFSSLRQTTEIRNDTLAIWDTEGLPNGRYSLRLSAFDSLGHESHDYVNNIEVVKSTNQVRPNRGALLSVDAGQIGLFIPPNALSQEEQVYIKECETLTPLAEPDITFTNFCFEITSNRDIVFAKPVTMTIKYPDLAAQNINTKKLAVYHLPNGQSDWVRLGGSVNTNESKITTRFTRLGVFALYEDLTTGSASGISAVEIAPRVFTPNSSGLRSKVDISYTLGQDGEVTCKVYNTAGRLIAIIEENVPKNHGENVASWYGKDFHGKTCSSGLYVVTIQAGGAVKTKTVVVMNSN